jgi:nitroreductase
MPFNAKQVDIDELITAESSKTKLEALAKFAMIAPSSHNTQPWQFTITQSGIEIRPDFNRRLIYGDPDNRFLFVSLGTAVKNLELASQAYGLEYRKDSYTASAATTRIIFTYRNMRVSNINTDLLQIIIDRHTNRKPYAKQPLPLEFTAEAARLVGTNLKLSIIADQQQKLQVESVVELGVEECFTDKNFRKELSHWIKPSLKRYELGMPGYTILVPTPISFVLPWIIRRFNITPMQKRMHRDWVLKTAACGVISGENNIATWIEVGRTYEDVAVLAEKYGIRTGILGAPIQAKTAPYKLQELLKLKQRPQLFFRMGFAEPMEVKSPRLAIQKVVN